MSQEDPTADYRKYPKSPSFAMVVFAAAVFLLVFLAGAYLVLHHKSQKMAPRPPVPTPNALLLTPAPAVSCTAA